MISKEEVRRIATLARLELTLEETEKMQKDLSAILDYMDILQQVKSSKVRKVIKARNELANNTRADEIRVKDPSLAGDLITAAPDKKDGYIKVKAVL